MSAPSPAPVAFGLTMPLRTGLRALTRRPGTTLLPVLLLLLPVLPVAVAALGVLRAGADAALLGLVAGAPADARGAVILRPDGFEVRLLVALGALLVVAAGLAVAAGLVAGATGAGATGPRDAVRRAWRAWPGVALVAVGSALVTGLAAAVVVALAVLAGRVRFGLTSVVLVVGLGALSVAVLRLSLGPAAAVGDGAGPRAAVRRAQDATRGSVLRLVLAAVVAVVAIGVPTALLWLGITGVLDALADAELLGLSPVAIGLWALLPVPVAAVAGLVVWGVGARRVLAALGSTSPGPSDAARPPAGHGTRPGDGTARA